MEPTASDALSEISRILSTHSAALTRMATEYEYSPPYSFGGPSGAYTLVSPYSNACEWCLLSMTFTAAGSAALSASSLSPSVLGLAAILDGGAGRDVITAAKVGADTVSYPLAWHDFSAYGSLTLATSSQTGMVAACVMFRRRRSPIGVIREA